MLPAGMRFMSTAAVLPASMIRMPFMMAATHRSIVGQIPLQKCGNRFISTPCNTAIQLNPAFPQRALRASSNPAADEHIHAFFL